MTLWRPTKNINLSLPEELIIEVDEAAKSKYMSRTEYIRYVLHKEVGGQYPEAVDRVARTEPQRLLDLDDS
jgi:metal-responsive CopG/Arc/MetJ family transcriptional regulator